MKAAFQRLIAWYREQRRDLPWRHRSDPYAILVSEVMLQQTRVEVVLAYYERFLERFPDCSSLAAASSEELHAAWAGLGYYRRARNLQAAARAVVEWGGFPGDRQGLLALPGVGEYTAAALESIAFGRPALALDGNAIRVLWRFLALEGDPRQARVRRDLAARVEPLIDAPGDFTQALMELGATLCKPTHPACLACPLVDHCAGKLRWRELPPPPPARPSQEVEWSAAVLLRPGQVFLEKAEPGELLEGMWRCPPAERLEGELELVGTVRHAITFRRITCRVYRGQGQAPGRGEWVDLEDLTQRALPALTCKVLRTAGLAV